MYRGLLLTVTTATMVAGPPHGGGEVKNVERSDEPAWIYRHLAARQSADGSFREMTTMIGSVSVALALAPDIPRAIEEASWWGGR